MNDPLRDKMHDWQASPPPGAWTKIAADLEEVNAEKAISKRLTAFESTPPVQIWNRLMQELHEAKPESEQSIPLNPVVPVRPLYPYLIRYGAAAILIGLLIWAFNSNPFENTAQTATASLVPIENNSGTAVNSPGVTPQPDPVIKAAPQQIHINEAPVEIRQTRRQPRYSSLRNKPVEYPGNGDPEISVNYPHPPRISQAILPVQSNEEGYIILRQGDGQKVRMSTKFAPLYYSLMNQPELSANASMLNTLQQRINRSPYIPDPNNLFDLLRLSDLIQQDQ